MTTVPAAYPFIEVRIDTSALQPVAQRSPGVIAIVGVTPGAAAGGSADVNKPYQVDTLSQAADLFAKVNPDKTVAKTPLYRSLETAILQDPKPSKIYGVRVAGAFAPGLSALEGVDDITFVSLAEESGVGDAAAGGAAATKLRALKEHVENMSAQGFKRIGVAMVDPTTAKAGNYFDTVKAAVAALKSDSSRMVLVAARGATTDVAAASMAAIAGYEPHISMVLKRVRGVTMPAECQFAPSEIKKLSEEGIIPIIDPSLIVGESLHFAEGRTFTTDASLLYIDIVRTLDDIDFRLKAGLIGLVGDARITKSGLVQLKAQTEGVLGPLKRRAVIDDFNIDIPLLTILSLPETAWTATERNMVVTARANRAVDMFVSVTYGPAIHQLKVTLAPKF